MAGLIFTFIVAAFIDTYSCSNILSHEIKMLIEKMWSDPTFMATISILAIFTLGILAKEMGETSTPYHTKKSYAPFAKIISKKTKNFQRKKYKNTKLKNVKSRKRSTK